MIRHCVFVRFGDGSSAAERAAIHADLEALRPAIDGMGKVHFSANVSPEPFARGFGHGFTEGGTDGVMVLDLEFTEM
ncbi:MAG: Dabb family protein [Mesorhizobium sp.]|nr:MAG: Dabb family protein [Mesorhizobium sp.]